MTKLTKNRGWVGLLLGLVAVVALVFAMAFQQVHANPADSVDQATDQTKITDTLDTEADLQANSTSDAEISDADADSSINNTNGDEAALATADLNNDESSTNETYTVKFAMPKEYINYETIVNLYHNSRASRMNKTTEDITIDGTEYTIYSLTTDKKPAKISTYFNVTINVPTNNMETSQWLSEGDWQYGDNIVAVPQDYTKMLQGVDGTFKFVNTTKYTATFDLNGGDLTDAQIVTITGKGWSWDASGHYTKNFVNGTSYSTIIEEWNNCSPVKEGHTFDKWTPVSGTLTQNATFTANYKATVNATFDPNYSGAETTVIKEVVGNNYTLPNPAPSRPNYDFTGWFTDPQSGTQVTSETRVEITTDHTLYAHWTEIPKYNITIVQPEWGGSVAADKTSAHQGETVTLTVTPDAKFSVKDVSIKDAAGNSLEYQTITENIQYSFTMPESDATAKITLIAEKPEEGYVITEGDNGTYVPGSGTPYTIRVNSDISRFANEVTLNGNPIDPANYDVRSGSTIVTLHSDYLDTLPAGTHQIGIKFVDETVNANLTIDGNSTVSSSTSSTSSTGDSIPFAGIFALVIASAGAVAFATRKRTQF